MEFRRETGLGYRESKERGDRGAAVCYKTQNDAAMERWQFVTGRENEEYAEDRKG
jgi:hypothetical protein